QKLKGHTFHSSTDTEVLAHLIGAHYDELKAKSEKQAPLSRPSGLPRPLGGEGRGEGASGGTADGGADGQLLTRAVMSALREVIGAYGIGVICLDCPGVIVGARRGSPLILGVGQGEH